MASVIDPVETRHRIRHPLQAVRKYIRTYVLLEGLALTLLFVAGWFWLGLLLDYGLFRLFAFDWIQELYDAAPNSAGPTTFRIVLLAVPVLVALGLVVRQVGLRWLREFSDPAVALVLERRFPRELGDRLITAVEIADPQTAYRHGFSQAMVWKTVEDAVDRLDRLPVADVFDWGRLRRLWVAVGAATAGVFVVLGLLWVGIQAATGEDASPVEYAARFTDVAAVHLERNALLMNTAWPRRAYLEVLRFQHTADDSTEMRVGRDEQRPDLLVRAVQWVTADRDSPGGWRPLRWKDLPQFLDPSLVDAVDIPSGWSYWLVDLDDLDTNVPPGLLPAAWQGRTAGEVWRELHTPALRPVWNGAGVDAIDHLLNWRHWTVDKIFLQEEKQEVRLPLRELPAYEKLLAVRAGLEELAESGSYSRRLRKLELPAEVEVQYRGATTKSSAPASPLSDNKFAVGLNELKESVRFRARGADYYTPTKRITLVPPPSLTELAVDKDEPAYLYYRLQGFDQAPLRGARQRITNYAVSTTGEMSTVEVPLGTTLVLRARTDRPLREPIQAKAPVNREAGAVVPDEPIVADADGLGFSLKFPAVTRPVDFVVEFHDEDTVKGRRRLRIRPVDDQPPEVINVDLAAVLRKPRFKADPGKGSQGTPADGFLITPDALLPFNGTLRDDHGLTRAGWLHAAEQIDLELIGQPGRTKERLPTLVLQGNATLRRLALVASAMQLSPVSPVAPVAASGYIGCVGQTLTFDLSRSGNQGQETFTPMEEFLRVMESKSLADIPANALQAKLAEAKAPPRRPRWDFQLKDEPGFDVKRTLPKLKASGLDSKQGQLHYLLKLSVVATDNNVETGTPQTDEQGRRFHGNTSRSKTPFQFLVVSENELLAQIAIEEEALFERLEKVLEKVKNGLTVTEDQAGKFRSGSPGDLGLITIRTDEVRKAVLDSASVTREVFNDYSRILKEMEVNRVATDKVAKVRDKIVFPLEDLVNPNQGNFTRAEDAVQRAYQALDDDLSANRPPNQALHLKNLSELRAQLESLRDGLNAVLLAMNEGIAESKLIEALILMERVQRRNTETLRIMYNEQAERLFDDLLNPPESKK